MTGRLLRVFGFGARPTEPSDQKLFRYRACGKTCHVDPIEIDREIVAAGGHAWADDLDTVARLHKPLTPFMELALSGDMIRQRQEQFDAALVRLVKVSRAVFGLPAVDRATGEGVTEAQAIGVLVDFVEFSRTLAEDALPFA